MRSRCHHTRARRPCPRPQAEHNPLSAWMNLASEAGPNSSQSVAPMLEGVHLAMRISCDCLRAGTLSPVGLGGKARRHVILTVTEGWGVQKRPSCLLSTRLLCPLRSMPLSLSILANSSIFCTMFATSAPLCNGLSGLATSSARSALSANNYLLTALCAALLRPSRAGNFNSHKPSDASLCQHPKRRECRSARRDSMPS